jgi:hypothetical protein
MIYFKYKNIYIFLGLICLLSFLIVFTLTNYFEITASKKLLNEDNLLNNINELTIVAQEYYVMCGHFKELERVNIIESDEIALKNYKTKYSNEKGWIMNRNGNTIFFSLPVNELCDEDKLKRHFAVKDGYLVIYQGPVGSVGKLLKITDIKVEKLPKEWKEKIENNLVDFNNEKELLNALDTLDEYM